MVDQRSNDKTIHETFDILGVPEAARNDTRLFVIAHAFLATEEGRAAARDTGLLDYFNECMEDYDEAQDGRWAARDYAYRVIQRHIGPITHQRKEKE